MALPPPREPGRYRIGVVCLGNICRSPMADVVLRAKLDDLLDDGTEPALVVEVASCGTAGWHVGRPMDSRAAATLDRAGYDPTRHRARQYDDGWAAAYDLLLAMDEDNLADLGGRGERVAKFRDLDPVDRGADVPDPYYGGDSGFEEVLQMVERTADAIVAELRQRTWESAPR
ncbi:low molecular weight protein-tyrosine-phosphatase [Nocardioides sp. GCM10027113]|uniref:low molecular weight protein-tyrosine-phosphatase n=1 Tax=unclassified Nocardioides TaxID=2615069 RepID=UPI00361E641F